MGKNLKISLALVALAALAAALFAVGGGEDEATRATAGDSRDERLVRDDSQKLNVVEDGKATFVEFLDFECESCRAAFPAIEELRERYGDRVTFVVRHFPLHRNSESAARSAEAAAAQGEFEAMYQRLFETQAEWGEKQTSQEEVFFGFAEELELDMDEFRSVYDDPATLAKIRRDKADGEALGVSGTPTFFFNGEKLEAGSFADVVAMIDAALES